MYLTQALMSNTPNADTHNAQKLVEILALPAWGGENREYGPFVPESLMPATYGFTYGKKS